MPNQFQINAVAVLPFESQTAAYEQKKKERCELPACCGRRQKQYNTMKNIIKAHLKPLAACLVFVFVAGLAGTYVQFLKGELLDAALEGISSDVFRLSAAFFAVVAGELAAYYGVDYFSGRLSGAS